MMIITSSLIREFFFHGVEKEYCKRKAYEQYITGSIDVHSDAMDKGSFFETICIGGGVNGKTVDDLPRKKNGDKTIDQVRIEEQKMHFEIIAKNTNMVIIPGFNTQVTIQKRVPFDDDILLNGTLDIFPVTVKTQRRGNLLSVVDLKLTSDIYADTRFSYNSWSEPGSLDNTQAYMYHELVRDIDPELNPHVIDIINKAGIKDYDLIDKHFFYYVFDYSPRLNKKSIEVFYDDSRRRELFESVKATRNLIVSNTNNDRWEEVLPSKYNCASCPLECAYRFTTESESKERDYDEIPGMDYEAI